ncbi:uncharacterized protein LOC134834483 [Culicoides brevitarsis]|uniref:uncharacterized protein LOC134834483 n=1 Tax=Culicoides brevitarsis TaxID=469753 RepID=UPI00307BFDD3
MATLNCDTASYKICRRGNKLFLVLLYNLCILLVLPHIVKQTVSQTIDVNKKVTDVYVSDYLKRVREVGNFDHYSLPSPFIAGFPSYGDYDVMPPYLPAYPPDYDFRPVFRESEVLMTTEYPQSARVPQEETQLQEQHPITFRYAALRQLNYSVNAEDSLQLIDVDYENDVYFLHNQAIVRVDLGENGAQFERIAVVEDTHEEIGEAHLITWHELLIVLVREGDHYNVYVKLPQTPALRNIQRLVFPNNKLRKCKLLIKSDQVFLIVTLAMNKAVGKIILYKWQNSHFIKQNEQETFVCDEMLFLKSAEDPLIVAVSHGSRLNTKTKANVYHVASNGKLDLLQYMFFGMEAVHAFTVKDIHYILACYSKNVCFIHKYEQGKFSKAHQIDRKFTHTLAIHSDNSLLGIQLPDTLVFSLNADLTQSLSTTHIPTSFLYKISFITTSQAKFLILFYRYPSHLNIQMIEMEINQEQIVGETAKFTAEQDVIKEKMNELRFLLESKGEIMREIDDVAKAVLRRDMPATIQAPVTVDGPLRIASGEINANVHVEESIKSTADEILHEIVGINVRFGALMSHLNPTERRYKRAFKPDYKTTKFIVKNLHYDGPEFKDLLLKSTSKVTSVVNSGTFETLNGLNLTKNVINNINLNDVVHQGSSEIITGAKTFNHVTTKTLKVKKINEVQVTDLPKHRSFRAVQGEDGFKSLPHDVTVDKIRFNRVNSLPWTNLERASDLKKSYHINGDLYLKRNSIVRQLNVNAVNNFPVGDLLTKNGDQQISSVIWINQFFAPSITTKTVNGINFKENVALQGQENHIRSHVAIAKMNVTSGIQLTEEDVANGRHVVGTRKEDLLQFYTGEVILQGSLTLRRVRTDSEHTKVLVGNRPFTMAVDESYWVDDKSQEIPSFKFHSVVSVPQLFTSTVNQHPASDYLMVHPTSESPKRSRLVFKHTHVPGNIVPESDKSSKLVQISRNCVRRGDSLDLQGTLRFDGELTVDSLHTVTVNGQEMANLVPKSALDLHFKGPKRLQMARILGDLVADNHFKVHNYNGTDVEALLSRAVYVNEPFDLDYVEFGDVRVRELDVKEMQGIRFDQFLSNVYSVLNSSTSVRNIRVSENAFFEHELQVDFINGVEVNYLFNNLVKKDGNCVLNGQKTFKNGLRVKNGIWTNKINEYDLQVWQNSALTVNGEQLVTGNWRLDYLRTKYLAVNYLNDVSAMDLLNSELPVLDIYSDLTVESFQALTDCKGNLPHDVGFLLHSIENPSVKLYNSLTCEKTLLYPMNFKSKFTDILTEAVTVTNDLQIHGKVEFVNRPYLKKAKSELINGINILNVHADALKYNSPEPKQLVFGPKKFIDGVYVNFAVVQYKLDSNYVNEVDVVALNNTIYRKNQVNYVTEKKIFLEKPIIGDLNVLGLVNGVHLANVAFEKDGRPLENVYLNQLQVVNDLIVENVNNLSLDHLLKNRVRIYGPPQEIYGSLTFQSLGIYGNNHIPFINGIPQESLVYRNWPTTQVITGKKVIHEALNLNGPVTVLNLNGLEFSEIIQNNVKLDSVEYLEALNVANLVAHGGVVVTETIDGRPVDAILHVAPKSVDKMLPTVPHLREIVQATSETVQSKVPTKRFLYLDYATDLDIVFKNDEVDVPSHTELLADSNLDCPEQLEVKITNGGKIFLRKHSAEHQKMCLESPIKLKMQVPVANCRFQKDLQLTWNEKTFVYPIQGDLKSSLNCFSVQDKHFVGFLTASSDHVHTFEVIYLTKSHEWGLKQVLDIQEASNAKIISTQNYVLLVVTSKKGIEFHYLNQLEQKFEQMETITGSFNLISDLVVVGNEKMIGLALKNSKAVTIFKLLGDSAEGPEIQFFQTLRFEARVKAVQAFKMNGDESHLAIIMTNGHFYIYRYNYIDGWIQINYSYFDGMESLVAFKHQNNEYLLVISPNSASAIRIYNQS